MTEKYFFDTYALIEIYKGGINYEKYKAGVNMITSKLNLLEFVYFLIREGKEKDVNDAFKFFGNSCVEYDNEILIKAAEMKFKFKKKRISYIDCVGYQIAKKLGVMFLTGDLHFKNKSNVKFVR